MEDHADLRQVLGIFLETFGHRARFAADAGSALVSAGREKFDVLLTDIGLPGRDGWALLQELEARDQLPPVRISMSACHSGKESARSEAAGCRAHLVKPFRPEELAAALQDAKQSIGQSDE